MTLLGRLEQLDTSLKLNKMYSDEIYQVTQLQVNLIAMLCCVIPIAGYRDIGLST